MPTRYTAKELIKMIENDGWRFARAKGSHYVFEHGTKAGKVVVPVHRGTMPVGTANGILKQAGLK
jgi:predicted RNA binding protein YcfA (HicA-like mRNA interferase family)